MNEASTFPVGASRAVVRDDQRLENPTFASTEEAVASARGLIPALRARAHETEQGRSVPRETIRDFRERGLFGLVTPRRWAGSELGMDALIQVSAALAEGCASSSWVYVVLSAHQWVLSLFPEAVQESVFSDPTALTASVVAMAGPPPQQRSGGFSWTGGAGQFCSGVDHAAWLLLGAYAQLADGSRERRFFLVPAHEAEIVDDWQTVGLRGTGSKSIRIPDSFIPDERTLRFQDIVEGTGPGTRINQSPLYRVPFDAYFPLPLIGPLIGAARAGVEALTQKLSATAADNAGGMAVKYTRLAQASAEIDAAEALTLNESRQVFAEVEAGRKMSPQELARCRRNVAFAAGLCRSAVNNLFEASGGGGIYDSALAQRTWRDVNAAAAHRAFAWDTHAPAYGRLAVEAAGSDGSIQKEFHGLI